MDYKTKPISRKDLRAIARWFRHQFKCKNKFRFDVINAFERIHQLFPQITTEVVESESTDVITNLDVPAACNPDMNGGYHIAVREHVYEGACRGIGGYRAHILHEMCHAILCLLGFTPILDRAFNNNEIEPEIGNINLMHVNHYYHEKNNESNITSHFNDDIKKNNFKGKENLLIKMISSSSHVNNSGINSTKDTQNQIKEEKKDKSSKKIGRAHV